MLIELAHAVFQRSDDGRNGGLHDLVENLVGLSLDLQQLSLEAVRPRLEGGTVEVPQLLEHRAGRVEEFFRRLHALKQFIEVAFQLFSANRLAVALALAVVAEIVGVVADAPFRPAGSQRPAAIAAADEAAQREIHRKVFALRRFRLSVKARLDFLVRLEADQRLVLALAQGNAPRRVLDIARVDRVLQMPVDLALARGLRVFGIGFEEALHFSLRLEAPRCVAFQRLAHDRGQRLVAHQHPAAAFALGIAIADRALKRPEAALKARFHLLLHLTAILLALQLALRGDDGLDELAFRRVLEFEIQALARRAVEGELGAQANVEFRVAGEALEVIEDNDVSLARIGAQVFQQLDHAGTAQEIAAARLHVVEDPIDGIAARGRVFAAPMLLAMQPVAVLVLFLIGHAAIDDRLLLLLLGHGSLVLSFRRHVVEFIGGDSPF